MYLLVLFGINVHMHMPFFFFYKNWITLYILFNNLLFKLCVYVVEYVMQTQVQSSRSTKSSVVRSQSPSHPVCQHLVSFQSLVYPSRDSDAFSSVCMYFVTNGNILDTLFLHLVLLHLLYHERNIFVCVSQIFSTASWTLLC